jgi:putative nucleotidyltransferase with HDIG domain
MDGHDPDQTGKPYIAIAVGDSWQRSHVTAGLTSFYQLATYRDISHALAGCRERLPLLVLAGEQLPSSGGYDFARMLRLDPKLARIPIVMLVAKNDQPTRNRVLQSGADRMLVDPFARSALIAAVSGEVNRGVERKWRTLPQPQRQALTDTLHMFNDLSDVIGDGAALPYQAVSDACAPLVEAIANDGYRAVLQGVRSHDNYSYAHSVRVATYLALFGFRLGMSKTEQVLLATAGLLHDVGKMSIPHEVLNKPGRLSAAEVQVMQGHVTSTVAYLERCRDLPKGVITIAAQHHEKLDGSGYPHGIGGSQLNQLARIASIVDVFSALTDRRVYKPSMDPEAALDIMADEMGGHLDIRLLGQFRQMLLDSAPETSDPA